MQNRSALLQSFAYMIQLSGIYLLKSKNLHFAATGISSLAKVPADFDIPP